jgi:hypothetical protein
VVLKAGKSESMGLGRASGCFCSLQKAKMTKLRERGSKRKPRKLHSLCSTCSQSMAGRTSSLPGQGINQIQRLHPCPKCLLLGHVCYVFLD